MLLYLGRKCINVNVNCGKPKNRTAIAGRRKFFYFIKLCRLGAGPQNFLLLLKSGAFPEIKLAGA
jgi:hypothetical protein